MAAAVEPGDVAQSNQSGALAKKIAAPKRSARRIERSAELPSGPFGANVEILKGLADNDADAAFVLAQGYQECQFFVAPKDESQAAAQAESSTVMQLGIVDQVVDQVEEAAKKNRHESGFDSASPGSIAV